MRTTERQEKARRNIVREACEKRGVHYDPVLIGFVVFAVVVLVSLSKFAHAQVPTPTPLPASPVDPGFTIYGIPVGAIIQVGVPAGLAIYMLVKMIPDLNKTSSTERAADRVAFTEREDKMRAENAAREIATRSAHEKEVEGLRSDNRRLQDMLVDRAKASG